MLTINGAAMPSPGQLSVSYEDRGDFSRLNVLGQRLADRLATKRVIDIVWPVLTAEAAAQLLTAVTEKVFFTVKFPDPLTGAQHECTCRCTERSVRMHRMEAAGAVWAEAAMRWEEM